MTIGDWWYDFDGTLQVRVSEFDDPRHTMVLAMHELFEALAAWANKYTEEEVTKFDLWFEKESGKVDFPKTLDEPGMHPECPYNQEHQYATAIEMILLTYFGANWWEYDEAIRKMSREQRIETLQVDENGRNKSGQE